MTTLLPVTDEMLAELRRLSFDAIAQGAALAVLPMTLLSLVQALEVARRPCSLDDPNPAHEHAEGAACGIVWSGVLGSLFLGEKLDPSAGTCPACSEVIHDWDCPRVGDGRPAEPRP